MAIHHLGPAEAIERLKRPSGEPVLPSPGRTSVVGLAAVNAVRRRLQPDAEWILELADGFAWWAYQQRQDVTAGPTLPEAIDDQALVVVRTDAGAQVDPADLRLPAWLAALNRDALGGAVRVLDTGRVVIETSYLVFEANLDRVGHAASVASTIALVQGVAAINASLPAVDGSVSILDHPTSGRRARPDEILCLATNLRAVAARMFRGSSPWDDEALWVDTAAWLTQMRVGLAAAGPGSLSLHIPLTAAMLRVEGRPTIDRDLPFAIALTVRENHRLLGSGVRASLEMPAPGSFDELTRLAVMLNTAEIEGGGLASSAGPMHAGAWSVTSQEAPRLQYTLFIAELLAAQGTLRSVTLDMARRAVNATAWLREGVTSASRVVALRPSTVAILRAS